MEKNPKIVDVLNQIVELELVGAVRYTQYSLMVFGHGQIPIMNRMREKAMRHWCMLLRQAKR